MYQNRYIQYLNFPPLPDYIVDQLSTDPEHYNVDAVGPSNPGTYIWTKTHNDQVDAWCKQNICADMFWAFQIMTADSFMHKDTGTATKINYIIDTGGPDVWTDFYADDQTTLLASYKIEPRRWHIFKADTFHAVRNVEPGQVRFAVTSRVFAR